MTSVGVRLRQSSHTNAVDVGYTYYREFKFYEGSPQTAHDLEQYTTVKLVVFDEVTNATINVFTCTVLPATELDSGGLAVKNSCSVNIKPTGVAANYLFHIVGTDGADFYQVARPAPIGYYSEPPSS